MNRPNTPLPSGARRRELSLYCCNLLSADLPQHGAMPMRERDTDCLAERAGAMIERYWRGDRRFAANAEERAEAREVARLADLDPEPEPIFDAFA